MKTRKLRMIGAIVLVLSLLFALPAGAQQENNPAAGQDVKSKTAVKKRPPAPPVSAPWAERWEAWRRMPPTLMGKIFLWEHYLMTNRRHLGLTDKQWTDIGSALNAQRKYRIEKWAERRVALLEIEHLLVTEPVDLTKVDEKVKAVAAISADVTMQEIRTLEKALSVLTPEQREKAMTFMKESVFMGRFRAY